MAKPSMRTALSLMLGKLEVSRGVDPLPDPALDAFLVGDLDYQLDPTLLERPVFRPSFSPVPQGVGRKQVSISFTHEIKGSGSPAQRAKLGTLLRACGMKEFLIASGAANQIADPVMYGTVQNGPVVAWGKTAAPTARFGSYLVEVVTGGASATAEVQVTKWSQGSEDTTVLPNTRNEVRVNNSSDTTLTLDETDRTALEIVVGGTPAAGDQCYVIVGGLTFFYEVEAGDDEEDVAAALAALIDADSRLAASAVTDTITVTFTSGSAPVTVTSGSTAVALGNSGATITPTWTGNLVEGQKWVVQLYETGYHYKPTSRDAETETITLYLNMDGVLHKATSCMGTVTFTGEAGNLGQAQFEFQGNYLDPVEEPAWLDAVLDQVQPPQVELAQMSIKGDLDFCAQSFTIALGNTLNLRECMNAEEGYDGAQITGREPTAQMNPEATYEAYTGMWATFSVNDQFPVHLRVGSEVGNQVRFYMERTNFTGLTYGDRNGILTNEVNLSLNGLSSRGDDELRIAFV
jgi:hypothetical protein